FSESVKPGNGPGTVPPVHSSYRCEMAIKSPLARNALGFLGGITLRLLRSTIDWKAVYSDPTVDTVHPQHRDCFVYACWHEAVIMPLALRGDRRMLAIASLHGDGDIISKAITQLG